MSEIAERIFNHIQLVTTRFPVQQAMFITLGPEEMRAFDRMTDQVCTIPDARCKGRGFMGLTVNSQPHPGITVHTRNLYER